MKKKWLANVALLFLVIQVISCRKFQENDKSPQNHDPLSGAKFSQAAAGGCRFKKITSWSVPNPPLIVKFQYNESGNPTRVEFIPSTTGRPQMEFRYDQQHRLRDLIAPYTFDPSDGYEFWYKYTCDTSNRVIVDTGYLFGHIVNGIPQPNPFYKSWANYEYDAQDRITQVTRIWSQNGQIAFVDIKNYEYDANGNLIGNGPYDDKVNFHRTNKIWQFIDRDYSMNNPATAELYNHLGYPVDFRTSNAFFLFYPNQLNLQYSEIVYECE